MANADFLKARTQIAGKVQKLQEELAYWQEELQAFDRVETTMRRLRISDPDGKRSNLKLEPDPEPVGMRKNGAADIISRSLEIISRLEPRKKGDLTQRILKLVANHPEGVTTKFVERSLLQDGFVPKGQYFNITVYKTLKRLVQQGQMLQSDAGDKLMFYVKEKAAK